MMKYILILLILSTSSFASLTYEELIEDGNMNLTEEMAVKVFLSKMPSSELEKKFEIFYNNL